MIPYSRHILRYALCIYERVTYASIATAHNKPDKTGGGRAHRYGVIANELFMLHHKYSENIVTSLLLIQRPKMIEAREFCV